MKTWEEILNYHGREPLLRAFTSEAQRDNDKNSCPYEFAVFEDREMTSGILVYGKFERGWFVCPDGINYLIVLLMSWKGANLRHPTPSTCDFLRENPLPKFYSPMDLQFVE